MALIQVEERVGEPHQLVEYRIFPVEKRHIIQPPGMRWVVFWHRPSAVIIQQKDGSDEILKIGDPTRKAQLILLALSLVGSLLLLLSGTNKPSFVTK
jgi:hypothetical protein